MKETLRKLLLCNRTRILLGIFGVFLFFLFMNAKKDIWKSLQGQTVPKPSSKPSLVLEYTVNERPRTPIPARHSLIPPYPYDYKFIINQPDKCKGGAPFLVILVIVQAKDTEVRSIIRRTWGEESSFPGVSIVKLFLTGISTDLTDEVQKMLQEESRTFQDIIQQDFLDTYNNLTLKTLMGMEWVTKHCPNASYVLKVDCDVFLNLDQLVHNLLKPELPDRKNYITGCVVSNTAPFRDVASKSYVPKEVYQKDIYPPYCAGPGYVFSGDMAKKIYEVAQAIQLINMEDVFVGICLEELKIEITSPPSDAFNRHRIEYNKCQFKGLILAHHYSPENLLQVWPDFQSKDDSGCPM